jgi:hypothetical protein
MEKNYYIDKAGKILGPFAIQQIREMASNGQLAPTDLIRKETGPWILSANVKGLIRTSPAPSLMPPTNASQDSSDMWYAKNGDQTVGPFSHKAMTDLLKTFKITSTDLVWKEGMPEWKTVSQIPAFFLIIPSNAESGSSTIQKSVRLNENDVITGAKNPNKNMMITIAAFMLIGFVMLASAIVFVSLVMSTKSTDASGNNGQRAAVSEQKPASKINGSDKAEIAPVVAPNKIINNFKPPKLNDTPVKIDEKEVALKKEKEETKLNFIKTIAHIALLSIAFDDPSNDLKALVRNPGSNLRDSAIARFASTTPDDYHNAFVKVANNLKVNENKDLMYLLEKPKDVVSKLRIGSSDVTGLTLRYGSDVRIRFIQKPDGRFAFLGATIGKMDCNALFPEKMVVSPID